MKQVMTKLSNYTDSALYYKMASIKFKIRRNTKQVNLVLTSVVSAVIKLFEATTSSVIANNFLLVIFKLCPFPFPNPI